MTTIVPGVLNGSKGALYYPPDEIQKSVKAWDGVPITVYHPTHLGQHVSAKYPGIVEKSGIGFIRNSDYKDKLVHEAWINVNKVQRVDKRVHDALSSGKVMELSTGLFTDDEPTPGTFNGKSYDVVARNYRPDHLAILPDQQGACSVNDGCGLGVNKDFSDDRRDELAKKGKALPDGSFPIESGKDLENAVKDVGRAKDEAAAKAHIIKRAKELGLTKQLPDGWVANTQVVNVFTKAAKADGKNARAASIKAEKATDKGDNEKAADAHYDAAAACRKAAMHGSPDSDKYMQMAADHQAKGDAHYQQAKGLSTNGSKTMDRATILGKLTANCACDKKKAAYNELSDDELKKLLAANDAKDGDPQGKKGKKKQDDEDEDDDEEDDDEPTGNRRMSAEDREALAEARNIVANEKAKLVDRLTVNVKDAGQREAKRAKLMAKPVAELRELVDLLPPAQNAEAGLPPLYIGAAGGFASAPAANFDPTKDILDIPTTNWAEVSKELAAAK